LISSAHRGFYRLTTVYILIIIIISITITE